MSVSRVRAFAVDPMAMLRATAGVSLAVAMNLIAKDFLLAVNLFRRLDTDKEFMARVTHEITVNVRDQTAGICNDSLHELVAKVVALHSEKEQDHG